MSTNDGGLASRVSQRRALLSAILATVVLILAACEVDAPEEQVAADPDEEPAEEPEDTEEQDDEAWPENDIRYVIAAAAGGGFDTAARNLQPYWQEELGVNLVADNQEGANFAIGAQVVADEGQACETVMFHAVPHLPFSYLASGQDVDYTYDDFHPIGAVQIQPGVVLVAEDSEFETFEDLIEAAQENPGEIRGSVSGLANNNYLAMSEMEEILDVEFNIVGYDGGGPAREAVVSGEVEFTHAAVFAALGIRDESRILAIHQEENNWPEISDDAPTLNELTGEDFGNNQSYYGVFAHSECYENYPERYQALEESFEAARSNPDYHEALDEVDELDGLMDESADEYDDLILQEVSDVEDAVEEDPEL